MRNIIQKTAFPLNNIPKTNNNLVQMPNNNFVTLPQNTKTLAQNLSKGKK